MWPTVPYQRTRTDRASNVGQAWTKRLWYMSSRRPTKSWPSRGMCVSLHREDILIPLQPIIHLIMINMCWIMSFSALKCSFRPWEHVGCFSLRWLMLCWTEANPAWMHSCAFLLYMFSQALHSQMGVWICSFTVDMCSSCVVLL